MKKKRRNIVIAFVAIIIVVIGFFGTLYYITSTVNNYTYIEKKWINENVDKTIDVYIEQNLPVFSYNGTGVYYDYINSLKEDTGLNLNVITSSDADIKLINKNNDELEKDDIIFYRDHFVVIGSSDNSINKIDDLNYQKIGVFEKDKKTVSYNLTDYSNVTISTYENYQSLKNALDNKSINYIVIPMYKYLNEIISSNYEILFHLDGIFSNYCLDINSENESYEELINIMTKFYYRWEQKSNSKIKEYFLNLYYDLKKYTEIQKETITNEDFIVGYIDNLPYEGMIGKKFTGLTDTYLSKFSEMTGVTYKYIEYDNTKDLNSALSNKKVDIALNYYSLTNENYNSSRVLGPTSYVVLAHDKNNIVVNSLYSLSNINVDMLNNMNLKYNMASKNLFEINDFPSVKTMLKNIDENSIIIIEKEVYDYYKDSSLKNYSIRYMDNVKLNNSFLLKNDNSAFNDLFDFYLSTLSSNEIKNESIYGVIETLKNNRIINFIISNLVYIVIGVLVVAFIVYGVVKKLLTDKKVKKEDRLYYFDAMTNLKNRNYLNDNMEFWSSTKVYPQTIIVIDINKLKVLNDRVGHEAGDNQIKAVASVLIKTQRDNSEIMRTDGDEFIVYLVGYDDKKISSYIHKLNREFETSLPYKEYGVSIGYKMILSDEMNIDDAINDSINMINKNKEK